MTFNWEISSCHLWLQSELIWWVSSVPYNVASVVLDSMFLSYGVIEIISQGRDSKLARHKRLSMQMGLENLGEMGGSTGSAAMVRVPWIFSHLFDSTVYHVMTVCYQNSQLLASSWAQHREFPICQWWGCEASRQVQIAKRAAWLELGTLWNETLCQIRNDFHILYFYTKLLNASKICDCNMIGH